MTAFVSQRTLNWSECDPGGIVFFPHYAKWAVDGLNEMLRAGGLTPNRQLAEGAIEGIPCVEFNMKFAGAPTLYARITHAISVRRIGTTSFTLRHAFSGDAGHFAEIIDTRVWAVHGPAGLSKRSLTSDVLSILHSHAEPHNAT